MTSLATYYWKLDKTYWSCSFYDQFCEFIVSRRKTSTNTFSFPLTVVRIPFCKVVSTTRLQRSYTNSKNPLPSSSSSFQHSPELHRILPLRAYAYIFETLLALKMWFNRKSSTKQQRVTHSPFHFVPVCGLVSVALRDGTKAHTQSTNDSQNIGRNSISGNHQRNTSSQLH